MTCDHSCFESSIEILEQLKTCIEKAELPFSIAEDEDCVGDLFFWKDKFYINEDVETPYSVDDFKWIKYWNDGHDSFVKIYFKNGEELILTDEEEYKATLYKNDSLRSYNGERTLGMYRAMQYGIQNDEFVVVNNALIEYNGHSDKPVLPEGIVFIQNQVFIDSNLKEVYFPKSLRYIGSDAFAYSKKLEHVDLNEGLEVIADRAFMNCYNLKNITLPSTLKCVERLAFYNTGIKSFGSIPEGCEISSEVFQIKHMI